MNTLLSRRLGGFLLAASLLSFSACQQDPQSANGPRNTLPLSAGGGTAHPALTYRGSVMVIKHGVGYTYYTVAVMDTDGTHQTNLVTAASDATVESFATMSWSPSGGSIAYLDCPGGGSQYIKALDVSVNSSGVPVASNVRTVFSVAPSDSVTIGSGNGACGPAWCATSTTSKIAFTRNHTASGSNYGLSELCTISQSGGTVTVLASYKKLDATGHVNSFYKYPTWSPDDSKIAVTRLDTIGHITIMIFSASTGAAVDSIPITVPNIWNLEWSRSGANQLAFTEILSSSGPLEIYYCTPTTGSTPTTSSVVGQSPTWSPNNSGVMYTNWSSTPHTLNKNVPYTSTTSTVLSSFYPGYSLNWKR